VGGVGRGRRTRPLCDLGDRARRQTQVRSFFYGYGHPIIYAAIVGVGVEVAIERAATTGQAPALRGWATAGLIAGFLVIDSGTQQRSTARVLVSVKLALVAVEARAGATTQRTVSTG
jgi:hypothetical protein